MSGNQFTGGNGLFGLAALPPAGSLLADTLYRARLSEAPDQYLRRLLAREAVDTSIFSPAYTAQNTLNPILRVWAGNKLGSISRSGSFAKGTANKSGTDLDLFISLNTDTTETLSEIYNKLDRWMKGHGYVTRRQNVSINVKVGGLSVDLVPGKRQNIFLGDHSLYRRKANTWTKTNVDVHIQQVSTSLRTEEMRVLKLWRDQKGLEFPSFVLELAVMKALGGFEGALYFDLANNVWKVLIYLRDNITTVPLMDPANTNNRISDDMTLAEKQAIRNAAIRAIGAKTWGEIVV